MPGTITGRVEIRVNGESLLIKSGAKATGIGGYERMPVMGDSGYHGYTEDSSNIPTCEFSLTDRSDKTLESLAVIDDGTLVFEAMNGGKVYIMRHAVCKRNFDLTAGEGEVAISFFGPSWEEQIPA
jgi:hypothetical protein